MVRPKTVWVAAVLLLVVVVAGSAAGCRLRGRNRSAEPSNSSQVSKSYVRETMQFGRRQRSYLVHLPSGFQAGRQIPLVIALYGGLGSAEQTMQTTGLNSMADKNGFTVVYPDGTGARGDKGLTRNVIFGFGYAQRNQVDDVGFIRELTGALETKYSIGNWVAWDGCQAEPQQVKSADGNIVIDRYTDGRNGTEVDLVAIGDGRHNWPKGNDYPGAGGEKPANDLMWEFFVAHPKE